MVYFNNISLYFWLFVMNSFGTISGNHALHTKALSAVYRSGDSLNYTIMLTIRYFVLFCITMWFVFQNMNGF